MRMYSNKAVHSTKERTKKVGSGIFGSSREKCINTVKQTSTAVGSSPRD